MPFLASKCHVDYLSGCWGSCRIPLSFCLYRICHETFIHRVRLYAPDAFFSSKKHKNKKKYDAHIGQQRQRQIICFKRERATARISVMVSYFCWTDFDVCGAQRIPRRVTVFLFCRLESTVGPKEEAKIKVYFTPTHSGLRKLVVGINSSKLGYVKGYRNVIIGK